MKNEFEFGDVVLAYVWCDKGQGKKVRPCIILEPVGSRAYDVAPLTSQMTRAGGKLSHEVLVVCEDEKSRMGLWKDSRISLLNKDIRVVKTSEIIKPLGQATRSVLTRCAVAWKNANN